MDDVCFVSCAVTHAIWGDAYLLQLDRLKESILKIYPDANLIFHRDTLPRGARPFLDSLYGLKTHAVWEAVEAGFTKVIWLDPAMILVDKVDDLFTHDLIAVKDESTLYNVVSDKCYEYFGLNSEGVKKYGWHLVGGSLYYFDFENTVTRSVFQMWIDAEKAGIFGSQQEQASEQLQGHRSDESVMAIAMYLHGLEPNNGTDVRYCSEVRPIMVKKHFR